MPIKRSAGNMYPWVDFTHTHLGGECSHKCAYCYVEDPRWGRALRYQGALRLIEQEFAVRYDRETLAGLLGGKYPAVIFEEHCNDLFAGDVPPSFIYDIILHCRKYQDNTFVFQSKNPARMLQVGAMFWPAHSIFGTTIETNRIIPGMSLAPPPRERYEAMMKIPGRKFITIEPVLDFDVDVLAGWIAEIRPEFLNLGADSKSRGLPEPTVQKVMALVEKLHEYGIELREKRNLRRLKT